MIETFCVSVVEKLVLVEMPIDPECIVDGSPERLNNPIVVQHVRGQEPAAAPLVPLAVGEFEITESCPCYLI